MKDDYTTNSHCLTYTVLLDPESERVKMCGSVSTQVCTGYSSMCMWKCLPVLACCCLSTQGSPSWVGSSPNHQWYDCLEGKNKGESLYQGLTEIKTLAWPSGNLHFSFPCLKLHCILTFESKVWSTVEHEKSIPSFFYSTVHYDHIQLFPEQTMHGSPKHYKYGITRSLCWKTGSNIGNIG